MRISDWSSDVCSSDLIATFCERRSGVMIENRPAGDVIAQHDAPDTLFYVDPPYMHETRSLKDRSGRYYDHEMTDADHRALLEQLQQVKGMVVISGYRSPLYDELLSGWRSEEHTSELQSLMRP